MLLTQSINNSLIQITYQIQNIQILAYQPEPKQMKGHFQTHKFSNVQQQNNQSNTPTTMTQYLTIIRNFILQMHQRVNQQFDPESLPSNLMTLIDRAAIKLKTNKQQLSMLQKQNRDLQNTKMLVGQLKTEQTHCQKRLGQKNDQISILRETVKTLYADNERLNAQKQKVSKQLVSSKQTGGQMKKKLKRQQDQMSKHKQELQKLTSIAEQRLGEYASQDKQKQKSIKKLTQQNQRQKSEINRLNRQMQQLRRANQELPRIRSQNEGNMQLIDTLRYENGLVRKQNKQLSQSMEQRRKRSAQDLESIRGQLSAQSRKNMNLSVAVQELQSYKQGSLVKVKTYEEDIAIRTSKLKQKSQQLQKYDQQISKLIERIEYLSAMSDEVISQNQTLYRKCEILQQRLQQGRLVQEYIERIKNEVNYSKSIQLGKLIEGLGSIRGKI